MKSSFKFYGVKKFLLAMVMLVSSVSSVSAIWVPQTAFPGESSVLDLASDGNGHAIVAYGNDANFTILASYFSNTLWTVPQAIRINDTAQYLAVAMDGTGTGLVVWYEPNNQRVDSAYFNGSVWTTPFPSPLDPGTFTGGGVDVAMDGSGRGVAIWVNGTSVYTAFFVGGFWTIPVNIGAGNSNTKIAYSSNGTVIAGWNNAGTATVSNYVGGVWSAPIPLDIGITEFDDVGIDANGHGLALWKNGTNNAISSYFNGSTWLPPQTIFPNPVATISPALAMAPTGTAVAVWVDPAGNGISTSFNGTTWGVPLQYTSGPVNFPSVSVDALGNALAVWATTTPTIFSSRLPLNGVWTPEEFVSDPSSRGRDFVFSLVNASVGSGPDFAAWLEGVIDGPAFPFADNTALPLPPTDVVVTSCVNRFASQTDRVNIITFIPSIDPTVIAYVIRRNGVIIATIPAAGPYVYQDHNRCRGVVDIYTVSSLDINGSESPVLPLL